jgi:hypothetical protein
MTGTPAADAAVNRDRQPWLTLSTMVDSILLLEGDAGLCLISIYSKVMRAIIYLLYFLVASIIL